MKICLPTNDNLGLQSEIASNFSSPPWLLVVESETQQTLAIDVKDKPSPQLSITRPTTTQVGKTVTLQISTLSPGNLAYAAALDGCRLNGNQLTFIAAAGCYVAVDQEATTNKLTIMPMPTNQTRLRSTPRSRI